MSKHLWRDIRLRAEGSVDPALCLRTVGADDVDVQIHQRAAKFCDAITANRVLGVHPENAVLVTVKGSWLAVCLQIGTGRPEVIERRLRGNEPQLHQTTGRVVALTRFGRPDIFNADQGSQFTSPRFTGVLQAAGVRISMDGRGRWMDNVFIERLWRSVKYECIYLHAFETGTDLRAGLTSWIAYYNTRRPHSTLAGRTPDEAYRATGMMKLTA
jgi:putative transposase